MNSPKYVKEIKFIIKYHLTKKTKGPNGFINKVYQTFKEEKEESH